MVAEIAFHHQREDFPPHPDDPSSGKIEGIVPFMADNIKGGDAYRANPPIARGVFPLTVIAQQARKRLVHKCPFEGPCEDDGIGFQTGLT